MKRVKARYDFRSYGGWRPDSNPKLMYSCSLNAEGKNKPSSNIVSATSSIVNL